MISITEEEFKRLTMVDMRWDYLYRDLEDGKDNITLVFDKESRVRKLHWEGGKDYHTALKSEWDRLQETTKAWIELQEWLIAPDTQPDWYEVNEKMTELENKHGLFE